MLSGGDQPVTSQLVFYYVQLPVLLTRRNIISLLTAALLFSPLTSPRLGEPATYESTRSRTLLRRREVSTGLPRPFEETYQRRSGSPTGALRIDGIEAGAGANTGTGETGNGGGEAAKGRAVLGAAFGRRGEAGLFREHRRGLLVAIS